MMRTFVATVLVLGLTAGSQAPALQTPEEIARFAELLATLPKPILAFCRSGTRSGKLYRAASQLR